MGIFDNVKFEIDEETVKKEYDYMVSQERLQPGIYQALLTSIDLKVEQNLQSGAPVPVVTFKWMVGIKEYDYPCRLGNGTAIYFFLRLLKKVSDVAGVGMKSVDFVFETYTQLEYLITIVKDYCGIKKDKLYTIKIGKNNKGYDTLDILEEGINE